MLGLVDATLIAAPPSTKNKEKQRDPQMHQTKKGNQWYFGMKAHIGADRDSKLVHTVVATVSTTRFENSDESGAGSAYNARPQAGLARVAGGRLLAKTLPSGV